MKAAYREIAEGERSLTVKLLAYIAEAGTIKGAAKLFHRKDSDLAAPRARLVAKGYIIPKGRWRFEVTEEGYDVLEGPLLPFILSRREIEILRARVRQPSPEPAEIELREDPLHYILEKLKRDEPFSTNEKKLLREME